MLLRTEDETIPAFKVAEQKRQGLQVDLFPRTDKELPALLTNASAFEGAQRVEVISPNLETLFMELTGKELRDS
jgi:hypothetical protein